MATSPSAPTAGTLSSSPEGAGGGVRGEMSPAATAGDCPPTAGTIAGGDQLLVDSLPGVRGEICPASPGPGLLSPSLDEAVAAGAAVPGGVTAGPETRGSKAGDSSSDAPKARICFQVNRGNSGTVKKAVHKIYN